MTLIQQGKYKRLVFVRGVMEVGDDCIGFLKGSEEDKLSAWTDGGSTFTNAGLIQFPQCTGGNNTITHFAVCTLASAGEVVVSGALNSSLNISSGIQPQFSTGSLSVGAD